MASETGFSIDDKIYEVPTFDSFTGDEQVVMYDYCGCILEDFVAQEDETAEQQEAREAKFDHPGFILALMHIAYQRGNPKVKPATVKRLIGSANFMDSIATLGDDEEGEAELPPALTTEPERSSESGSVEWNESSGNGSTTDLERPESGLHRIGTTR